jgi:DNA-binding NtrC family response regulator
MLPPAAERAISTPRQPVAVPTSRTKGRILIIDDEPRLAQAVRDMIGDGHETRVVTTGNDALQILTEEQDGPFDLILCDLHMPGISGMDLHQKMTELRPAVAERMIFMTGGTFSERSREFVGRVNNTFIDKPVDMQQLRAMVETTLERLA